MVECLFHVDIRISCDSEKRLVYDMIILEYLTHIMQDKLLYQHKGEHSALLVLVGEFNADEFSDIYARLHEFVELDEKENKIALLIIVADTQCFVGFIRRLTPKECWRLQGFSDEQYLKSREAGFSDSQQYKQAGNAVTINVVEALAKRIKIIDERNKGGLNG